MTKTLACTLALSTVIAMLAIAPAEAAWSGFFNREVGFSYNAPAGMKAEKTTYKLGTAQPRAATAFRVMEDNIQYNVTVVEVGGMAENDAIKAATEALQAGRKILSHDEARVESMHGHKMSIELPNNGGRSVAAIYFKNGHLIQLDATVLPANGDYETPDTTRFADSIAFGDDRIDTTAVEMKLQK